VGIITATLFFCYAAKQMIFVVLVRPQAEIRVVGRFDAF
jgi:hypothetical protein